MSREEKTLKIIEDFYVWPNVEVIVCDTTNLGTPDRVDELFKKNRFKRYGTR